MTDEVQATSFDPSSFRLRTSLGQVSTFSLPPDLSANGPAHASQGNALGITAPLD